MFKLKPFKKVKSKKVHFFKWKIKLSLALLLILLILILVAGGLGYAVYTNNNESKSTGTADESNTSQTSKTVDSSVPSATSTPTPTPETTYSPTATPPPAATPPVVTFAVTAVSAEANQDTVCPAETVTVHFTGFITANTAGTVHYHWVKSIDGFIVETTSDETFVFYGAGTQTVTTDWAVESAVTLRSPSIWKRFLSLFEGHAQATAPAVQTYSAQLVITSPNAISSNQASFVRSPEYCPDV